MHYEDLSSDDDCSSYDDYSSDDDCVVRNHVKAGVLGDVTDDQLMCWCKLDDPRARDIIDRRFRCTYGMHNEKHVSVVIDYMLRLINVGNIGGDYRLISKMERILRHSSVLETDLVKIIASDRISRRWCSIFLRRLAEHQYDFTMLTFVALFRYNKIYLMETADGGEGFDMIDYLLKKLDIRMDVSKFHICVSDISFALFAKYLCDRNVDAEVDNRLLKRLTSNELKRRHNKLELLVKITVEVHMDCLEEAFMTCNGKAATTLIKTCGTPSSTCFKNVFTGYDHNECFVELLLHNDYKPTYEEVLIAYLNGCKIQNISRFNIKFDSAFVDVHPPKYFYTNEEIGMNYTAVNLEKASKTRKANDENIIFLLKQGVRPTEKCLINTCKSGGRNAYLLITNGLELNVAKILEHLCLINNMLDRRNIIGTLEREFGINGNLPVIKPTKKKINPVAPRFNSDYVDRDDIADIIATIANEGKPKKLTKTCTNANPNALIAIKCQYCVVGCNCIDVDLNTKKYLKPPSYKYFNPANVYVSNDHKRQTKLVKCAYIHQLYGELHKHDKYRLTNDAKHMLKIVKPAMKLGNILSKLLEYISLNNLYSDNNILVGNGLSNVLMIPPNKHISFDDIDKMVHYFIEI